MKPLGFMGVENEFQLIGKEWSTFDTFDHALINYKKANAYFERSPTAIRTADGGGIYLDGSEPEVCSPPSRIKKGAATEVSKNLYNMRKTLVDMVSDVDLSLIGYSTHYNVTSFIGDHVTRSEAMKYLSIPYALFTLNPLSYGVNLRGKEEGRLEMLGDYIENLDQVRAFLLFYLGTTYNLEKNPWNLPFFTKFGNGNSFYTHPVQDGRYSEIEVDINGSGTRTINAQTYLEIYYKIFKEGISLFATEEEMNNLEGFINGKKELEIDKFKKYARLYPFKISHLEFKEHPFVLVNPSAYKEKGQPEGELAKFLGEIVKMHSGQMEFFGDLKNIKPKLGSLDWEVAEIYLPHTDGLESLEISPLGKMDLFSEVLGGLPPKKRLGALKYLCTKFKRIPLERIKSDSRNAVMKAVSRVQREYISESPDPMNLPKIDAIEEIEARKAKIREYNKMEDTSDEWDLEKESRESIKQSLESISLGNLWRKVKEVDSSKLKKAIYTGIVGGLLSGLLIGGYNYFSYKPKVTPPVTITNSTQKSLDSTIVKMEEMK